MPRLTKYRRLSDDGLRQLIAEFNIVFEGPLPPQKWPLQYISIFAGINDIKRIGIDEYCSSENRGLRAVTILEQAVVEINHATDRCCKIRSNEGE